MNEKKCHGERCKIQFLQNWQNHFPRGMIFTPMHSVWNHSILHFAPSHAIIWPKEPLRQTHHDDGVGGGGGGAAIGVCVGGAGGSGAAAIFFSLAAIGGGVGIGGVQAAVVAEITKKMHCNKYWAES